jgi:hypothetical protein
MAKVMLVVPVKRRLQLARSRLRQLVVECSSGSQFSFFALPEPHSQHRTSHARLSVEQPWFSRAEVRSLELAY